jgi:hypothetical protein
MSGDITVNAAYNGIKGKDGMAIYDGNIDVTAGNDGIKSDFGSDEEEESADDTDVESDTSKSVYLAAQGGKVTFDSAVIDADKGFVIIDGGNITVAAADDAISASQLLSVNGGDIDISQSYEGLEAPILLVSGGNITVNASDDAINSGSGEAFGMGNPGGGRDQMPGGGWGDRGAIPTGGAMPTRGARPDGGRGSAPGAWPGGLPDTDTLPEWPDTDGAPGAWPSPPDGDGSQETPNADGTDEAAFPGEFVGTGGFPGGGWGGMGGSDDSAYIRISGGVLIIKAGGDGIDANGDLYISGGEIYVSGPSQGMEGAIDHDGEFAITGGKLFAAGSVIAPSSATTQTVITANLPEAHSQGETIALLDVDGNELMSYTALVSFSTVTVSCPEIASGGTYEIAINGSMVAQVTADTTIVSSGNSMIGGRGWR